MRVLAAVILVVAAACTKDATAELQRFGERACGCADKKDVGCARAVLADVATFLRETKHAKGDEAKTAGSARRMGECLLAAGVTSEELAAALEPPPEPVPGSAGSAPPSP